MSSKKNIVIIGASGAIGGAFTQNLVHRDDIATLHAFSRQAITAGHTKILPGSLDLLSEPSLAAAAERAAADGPIDWVIVATGMLHENTIMPEKSLRDVDPEKMARVMAINTIGPALVMKHFLPKLHRDRPVVFAALSARVGSIGDNFLGGWYSYRAAKSALNMLIKNASIEMARRNNQAMIVGLHPGTVDSNLSQPFKANVAADHLFTPDQSVGKMIAVIDQLTSENSGKCFAFDGSEVLP